MIHAFEINGLEVTTGDLVCTVDGGGPVIPGQFWRLVGKLIPGKVDHIVIYIGPGGMCVEAGAKGVISFKADAIWNSQDMFEQRSLIDEFYGIACPLAGKNMAKDDEDRVRENVAAFCLAQIGKPYNINFLDSSTENAYYCSQLAYRAYFNNGIDLNTVKGIPKIPFTESIIFPQEIWEGCRHQRPVANAS